MEQLELRLDQALRHSVKKEQLSIPVCKPKKEWYVRTHPNPEFRLKTRVIELKEERMFYLVDPSIWEALEPEPTFRSQLLVTAVTHDGAVFLWPIPLSPSGEPTTEWSRSAILAVDRAVTQWVRVTANRSLEAYELAEAPSDYPAPEWPAGALNKLLRIAFQDRFIDSLDHPVLKQLRGED